jgi:cyclic pyranopterin monophosphate synthase
MHKKLSHVSPTGAARMVDVSGKAATLRRAVAEGFVVMKGETLRALMENTGPKGEVLSVARVAGIMAAKRCGELIPLCHPLPVEQVTVDFAVEAGRKKNVNHRGTAAQRTHREGQGRVRIIATAVITAKTGIEMEALTAVSVAGLTIIDMLKAIDPAMRIEGVRVIEKTGGKSDYKVPL